jgi:hypothetical protein
MSLVQEGHLRNLMEALGMVGVRIVKQWMCEGEWPSPF